MSKSKPFYEDDLAYIHDVGFNGICEGCAPGLLDIFSRQLPNKNGLVVDLGCGSGVWAQALVEAGYQALGVDYSSAMIALSKQRVPSAEFHVGSVWNYGIPKCQAVTALGEVVCYRADKTNKPNLRSLVSKIHDSLEDSGLLIFDVAEVGLDRDRKPTFWEGDDWTCLGRFEYDEKRDRLIRHITTFRRVGELFRRSQERHVLQLYRANDVADLLRKAGFRVRTVRKFGEYRLFPKRVGFVARKA